MGAFEFNKCCFCVDLNTGCFIIGYLSLIGSIFLVVSSILAITLGGVLAAVTQNPDKQTVGVVLMVGAGVMLLSTVLLLTFIIVLLVGLHKNKPGHVKAYLIYNSIYISASTFTFIVSAAAGAISGVKIAERIFNILLSVYFLVIRSQYLVMKRPERGPAINTA